MKTIWAALWMSAVSVAQTVTIVNSGSTNIAGFQIVVHKSGKAEYASKPRRAVLNREDKSGSPGTVRKTISKSLARAMYADVAAARPLASLPPRHCMKSASFGTRLTVGFGDDVSPDLSCGDDGSPKMQALIRDTNAIVKIFRSQ